MSRVTLFAMKRCLRCVLVLAVVLPLTVVLMFARPGVALACTCAYYPGGSQVEQQLADFAQGENAIFTGSPVAERREDFTVYYDFEVREVFRGEVGKTTTVSTAGDSAACGTTFDVKEEYLVFATTYDTQDAPLSVNSCSATTLSSDTATRTATVKQFGEPREVVVNGGVPTLLVIVIGFGAFAAAAGGAAGWSLYRRRSRYSADD
ncbi:hypothetical protein O4220_25150 [Rhodococcus ruber]|uniref:Tissue inhibitor of metalloproteinase n=1 Tax=Rhodococcus ruber TaxID=1830 RepID=A0ABT4MQ25_9NOCA|nr:hypothetical protein [Rhodococcus ruber]MCZ4521821.1 hypothetical protein [Rhodococcus ruber]